MKRIFIALFIILPFVLIAQPKLKKKTIKASKYGIIEEFYVLKTDNKTRHGQYNKSRSGKTFIKGKYINGQKGIFNFYAFGEEPSVIYDFSKNKVINYLETDIIKDVYSTTLDKIEVDRPPLPLFSQYELRHFIAWNVQYPNLAKEQGISGRSHIAITINKSGQMVEFKIFESSHDLLDNEALRVYKLLPNDWTWTPSIKEGEIIESVITLPLNFQLN